MTNPELLDLLSRPRGSLIGSLLDAAPVGVSFALDGQIGYANPACARMWGYEQPEHMHGVSFFALIAPESREFVHKLWNARSPETRDPWVYELRGLRPSGEPFPFRCTSLAFSLSDGKKATFAFFEDFSEDDPNEQHLRCRCQDLIARIGE